MGNYKPIRSARPRWTTTLPASVRYDETLSSDDKIVYSELTGLCAALKKWVSNEEYFKTVLGMEFESVKGSIGRLSERGHIKARELEDGRYVIRLSDYDA